MCVKHKFIILSRNIDSVFVTNYRHTKKSSLGQKPEQVYSYLFVKTHFFRDDLRPGATLTSDSDLADQKNMFLLL